MGPAIYGIFSDNKYYNQETTRPVPSPNRKAFNHYVQRSEAMNGAIKVLGRETEELDTFIQVIDGVTSNLVLNKELLARISPGFDLAHLQIFSNGVNNLKVFGAMIARNQKPNPTQLKYIETIVEAIKKPAAAISALITSPLARQLTNYSDKKKKELGEKLKAISEQGRFGNLGNLKTFIDELAVVHTSLANVFDPEPIKPVGTAIVPRHHMTKRVENLKAGLGRIVTRAATKAQRLRTAGQMLLF